MYKKINILFLSFKDIKKLKTIYNYKLDIICTSKHRIKIDYEVYQISFKYICKTVV